MSTTDTTTTSHRTRWLAIGAAVAAVAVAVGGFGTTLVGASDPDPAPVVVTIEPCRLMDDRVASQVGPYNNPVGQHTGGQRTVQVTGSNGNCTIPGAATGIIATVTAVNPNPGAVTPSIDDSFLTVFPTGSTRPTASNLNYVTGQAPTPTSVTVDLGTGGAIELYNKNGTVNVIIDITAYLVDHDHLDVHYTRAEVDAAIAAAAPERDPVAYETSDSTFTYNTAARSTWQDVMTTQIVVPTGHTAVVTAHFGSQANCYGSDPSGRCAVRILLDGTEMEPSDVTTARFLGTWGGDRGFADSYKEETSILRVEPATAGTRTITVQAYISSVYSNTSLTLDTRILFVEAHLQPTT